MTPVGYWDRNKPCFALLISFDEIVSWLHKYISPIKIDLKNIQDQIKKLRVYITIFCCESDPIKHMILWVILSL